MCDQNQSVKDHFIQLQSILASQITNQATLYQLTQLVKFLRQIPIKQQGVAKNQVYEELRTTVNIIFIFLNRQNQKKNQLSDKIEQLIKQLLIQISQFCSSFYCFYHPIGCGEMIREFLTSECHLFGHYIRAAAAQFEQPPQKKEDKMEWIWAKYSSFKTQFFCNCIQVIMSNLSKFQSKFSEMSLIVIGQYLRLLYFMDDYLIKDKLFILCVSNLQSLENLFQNPTKQLMANANKQHLDEIIDYFIKLLRSSRNQELKRRVQMLGALFGITLLALPSIQKKLVGCKILSKYSYQIFYRSSIYVSEAQYSNWLVSKKIFELLFEDHCQISLIKSCEDTFKLLVKRGLIDKDRYCKFFVILQKGDHELKKAMFKLIEPFRMSFDQIQIILQILSTNRGTQLYDDEFFYFVEGLSRYSTENLLKKTLVIIQSIINSHYRKIESYLARRRAVECYAYVFERLGIYKDTQDKLDAYCTVVSQFLAKPSQNKLVILKSLFENISEAKMDIKYQHKLAGVIINDLNFIQHSLVLFNSMHFHKDDLIAFIRLVLTKYKKMSNTQGFKRQVLMECVNFPDIFEQMLELTKDNELQDLFNSLVQFIQQKQFTFSCIKWVFIRLNYKHLKPINKQYTEMIATHVTVNNPFNFIGLDRLKNIIFNSSIQASRRGACQLLVQIFTNFSADFRQQGEVYLISFLTQMIDIMNLKLIEYFKGNTTLICVAGVLQLMEQLMLTTEYFGVGSLRAHNSLVPTSTTLIKVYNNATYGDDVWTIFQKKFPSNKTLFEVIVEIAKQFKIGPLDMALEYSNNVAIKHNGLTLQQLKLNNNELNAIKLYQSRVKNEPLLIDGVQSVIAKNVFTEIFNRFAPSGKMGKKQCGDYIEAVTLGFCPIFDSRISNLFDQYDSDHDDIINLDDFLRYYRNNILDQQKKEVVEKNLCNLRYRRDLKAYDGSLDLNEEVLFRYHIWKHKEIYEHLFKLSHQDDFHISAMAQKLLLRLPTYSKVLESLTDVINFSKKDPFQIQYILTALQSQIANKPQASNNFVKSKNHLIIFEYLSVLAAMQIRLQSNQNCFIISLHILRSLLNVENLKTIQLKQFPFINLNFPKTEVFIKIIRKSINLGDSTLLEPAFALQLTQESLPIQWIQKSAFSKDKDTRILTCNFLYVWLLNQNNKGLNLFSIEISPVNNEQWFNLLTYIIKINLYQINIHEIFASKIKVLENGEQNLQDQILNPIINGSLKIIREIYFRLDQTEKILLNVTLNRLLPKLVSNQNRSLSYQLILIQHPQQLLNNLSIVANIKISKQIQPRNKHAGIKNLGCICYMNSILQQFFMIQQFYNLVMNLQCTKQETQINGIKLVDDFLGQLQEMYIHLKWTQKQYYDPLKFCLAIKDAQGKPINTHIQEDAHQFLNSAFGKMEEYSKKQGKLGVLQNIFGGKTVTQIICLTCKNKIQVLEHFYHLSVQVNGIKTLKESFDKIIQPEEISDYFCQNCNKKVQKITKQMLIKQAPEILIINLQRIIFDLEKFLKVKVHTKLQFNQTLDLRDYLSSMSEPTPYVLKGVVIHSGTSEGGHYYSLIKKEGKWFKFNDQSVTLFAENDLGRQAFGGDETIDQWGELSSSTNAYILFYEKVRSSNTQSVDENLNTIESSLKDKVLQQNKEFTHQIQFNQPSFFAALHNLYKKLIINTDEIILNEIFSVYFKVMNYLFVNSEVKSIVITQVGDSIQYLLQRIPQKSKQLLIKEKINLLKQTICFNNNALIRDLSLKILTKAIIIAKSNGDTQKNQEIMSVISSIYTSMIDQLSNEELLKNIHKSYQYFSFWKIMINFDPLIQSQILDRDGLGLMLAILMGKDCSFPNSDKKRSDIQFSEAIPIIEIIVKLIKYKKQVSPITNQMAQFQLKMLNNSIFYYKMMRLKIDQGLLSPIISFYAYENKVYSQFIAEILLKSMNSLNDIEDKNQVFNNIKAFCLIQDQFTSQRIKWIIGIPQLNTIRYGQYEFGFMITPEQGVFSYVSSLFYIEDNQYKSLLSAIYDARNNFNSFSTFGIISLLKLAIQSQCVRDYLLSLPSPCYFNKTCIDWVQSYAVKVKNQEHYSLPIQKNILYHEIINLFHDFKEKAKMSKLFNSIPINKYVIGKNFKFSLKDFMKCNNYQIDMWTHETYFLPNKSYQQVSAEVSDEFSLKDNFDWSKSRYFIKNYEIVQNEDDQIDKCLTMITFSIKAYIKLIISVNIPSFNHIIHLTKGEHSINCPYHQGNIVDIIDIEEGEGQISKEPETKIGEIIWFDAAATVCQKNEKHLSQVDKITVPQINININLFKPEEFDPFAATYFQQNEKFPTLNTSQNLYMEISCKECTYLNVGRQYCEMCNSDLFK